MRGIALICFGLGLIALGVMQFLPTFDSAGYLSYNYATQEVKPTNANPVKEFTSQYVGDELIEENKTFSLIQPIESVDAKSFATNVEVNVDGSIFSCAPKGNPPPTCPVTPPPCPSPVPNCPCVTKPPPVSDKVSWGITYTHVPEAQQIADGDVVKVCLTDTGVEDLHPGLRGVILKKISMMGDDGGDRQGHGTHTAGTIASVTNGIGASRAKIIAIKVLGDNGSGSMQGILQGFQRCAQEGAQIVSASLGSDQPSPMFQQVVRDLASRGIWVVMAGGNNGSSRFSYPAAYAANVPRALAVVATMPTGGRANFSQYQPGFPPQNTISAPGTNILSTFIGGQYRELSGTSMATPLVAGIIADMIEAGKTELKGNRTNDPAVGIVIDALMSVR